MFQHMAFVLYRIVQYGGTYEAPNSGRDLGETGFRPVRDPAAFGSVYIFPRDTMSESAPLIRHGGF